MKSVLQEINLKYENDISSKFMITLGDEFQGLLCNGANVMHIITEIEQKMYLIKMRFGVDGENQGTTMLLNCILSLLTVIKSSWSKRQREVIWDMLQNQDSQIEMAKRFNIKQPTVQKILSTGKYYAYKDSIDTVGKVLEEIRRDDVQMHFSIGAHPAFICPVHGEEDKAGYRLYFAGLDGVRHYGNANADGLAMHEDLTLPLQDHRAVITKEFFDRCTYIITGNQTKEVGLEDPNGKRIVTMYFDMPLFALWSPEKKNAPFLCIEPWFGRCDSIDFDGSLEEREYNNCLEGGEIFETEYVMKFEG